MRNSVYSDIPSEAAALFETVPQLQALFLRNIQRYPEVAADLERGRKDPQAGGYYYQAYQAAAKALGGETL